MIVFSRKRGSPRQSIMEGLISCARLEGDPWGHGHVFVMPRPYIVISRKNLLLMCLVRPWVTTAASRMSTASMSDIMACSPDILPTI